MAETVKDIQKKEAETVEGVERTFDFAEVLPAQVHIPGRGGQARVAQHPFKRKERDARLQFGPRDLEGRQV